MTKTSPPNTPTTPRPDAYRRTAQRLVHQLADLFDALAPESPAEAEEELRDAGFDPPQIGHRLELHAHKALTGSLPPAAHDARAAISFAAAAFRRNRKELQMSAGTAYDPFHRGPFPVGVRTMQVVDTTRHDRPLPIEIWYPAIDAYTGQDLARASRDQYVLIPSLPALSQYAVRDVTLRAGVYPLVVFSHGSFAHRRQSSFLCTHLASHGYIVAAVDHSGNTVGDTAQAAELSGLAGEAPERIAERIKEMTAARVPDIRFLLDHLLNGSAGNLTACIDSQRIGIAGHSFGGWTALAASALDSRIQATLTLAPGGSSNPRPGMLPVPLPPRCHRNVPTLFLVADRDTATPLAGMYELFGRTTGTKKMVVLKNADHFHFCDYVEQAHEMFRTTSHFGEAAWISEVMPPMRELCPGELAYLFVRGLGLAHMDAFLKGDAAAARFLAGDIEAVMARHGVSVGEVGEHVEMTEATPEP